MDVRKQRGGRLFFYAFCYWLFFMLASIGLGFLKLFIVAPYSSVLTFSLWFIAVVIAYYFISRRPLVCFRDVWFIGFFWVWLSVMFEYWFLTYLLGLTPDTVLKNNMLFSSFTQITTYVILFFSPVLVFLNKQNIKN